MIECLIVIGFIVAICNGISNGSKPKRRSSIFPRRRSMIKTGLGLYKTRSDKGKKHKTRYKKGW